MHWIDPDSLPEIVGCFERFLINPHGDADGLILSDGAEVHFPPHMAREIVPAVEKAAGGEVRIRGVRPRGGDVFAAVAITLPDGTRIEDQGPPEKDHKPKKPAKPHHGEPRELRTVSAKVRRALHGPKGERRGVLLETGEIVRFPPHAADIAAPYLKVAAAFVARGKSLRTRLGEVVEAEAIGGDLRSLQAIDGPSKPKKPKLHPAPHHARDSGRDFR